jgi:dolichyl-diphosphooligosaccharide--protein glycosyltransferase
VLGPDRVNFLENDAWYHVRVIEHQVRNFPHRLTVDPYAAPGGMYVPLAPLFDTLIATVVWATAGSDASAAYIERVSALAPPVMGALAIAAVWWLAALAFGRWAGLMAALLAAVLPGHFLDRTLLGFVDHHALEAWLSMTTLAALAWALSTAAPPQAPYPAPFTAHRAPRTAVARAVLPGACLGLYLLGWGSGAFFVAILTGWILLGPIAARDRATIAHASRVSAVAAVVAVLVVGLFQDPALYRYDTQIASLALWLFAAAMVGGIGLFGARFSYAASTAVVVAAVALVAIQPGLVDQVRIDLGRFVPDDSRMAVLEARPLMLYSGRWDWNQPWLFFRTGFFVGGLGTIVLAMSIVRSRRLDHLLIAVFAAAAFAATLGQNRFGYYLVPAVAVVMGWLAAWILGWSGLIEREADVRTTASLGESGDDASAETQVEHARPHGSRFPFRREVAVIVVAGATLAPNIVPAARTTARTGGMPAYWAETMQWLRSRTPEPFGSSDFYYEPYEAGAVLRPSFSVLNWWDHGYWILQSAHRVPVSNPTQANAPDAARFYATSDEAEAMTIAQKYGARYVLADFELPFREMAGGALAGRFENVVRWAGLPASQFYRVCFVRDGEDWRPVWLFREPYYRSMVYRMMVLGGTGVEPTNAAWVVQTENRVDLNGAPFCELTERRVYATSADARRAANAAGGGREVVGLDPWQPAFPLPALTRLREVFSAREKGQPASEAPMVRVFEITK